MPMMANRAAGSKVRQAMMIFVVSVTGSWNTGRPMSRDTASASAAFLNLMVPPNTVPVSMKFGGMMYMSFSSCRMDICDAPPKFMVVADGHRKACIRRWLFCIRPAAQDNAAYAVNGAVYNPFLGKGSIHHIAVSGIDCNMADI